MIEGARCNPGVGCLDREPLSLRAERNLGPPSIAGQRGFLRATNGRVVPPHAIPWPPSPRISPDMPSRSKEPQAAVTKTRPARRVRGLLRMTISTSWLSEVRNRINRSTEKPPSRYFESAETLGWLMPNCSAAFPCDKPRRCRTSLIAKARRTFVCRSSASAKPRSANTFPELLTILPLRPALGFAISALIVLPGQL